MFYNIILMSLKDSLSPEANRKKYSFENQAKALIEHFEWKDMMSSCEANIPVKSLDKTTPTGEVLGDISSGSSSVDMRYSDTKLNIRLSDLSLNKDVSSYNTMYSFTFNYDPKAMHTKREEAPVAILETNDEVDFWRYALGKEKKKYKTTQKQFGYFGFMDQYEIFKKHFNKWLKTMNTIIPNSVVGYTVCIETTKQGILHAHGIIYSDNNYVDMCCKSARTVWATVSKGRVCAMENAFAAVKSEKHWVKYVKKDLEKIL